MMKRLSNLLAAAALVIFAHGILVEHRAWADDEAKPAGTDKPTLTQDNDVLFKQLDKNSDGQVADDEVPQDKQRLLKRLLRTADKDGNGKLSREEFVAGLKSRDRQSQPGQSQPAESASGGPSLEERFRERDRNGDGRLTADDVPEEFRERFAGMLRRADKDGDKAINLEEFKKASGLPAGQPGQPGGPPPGLRDGPPPLGDIVYRAIDADGDGTLNADELAKASESLKKLDKDGDGKVTRRELMPPREGGGPEGPDRPAPEQFIRRLMAGDKNNDGQLSREELPERLQRGFDRLDANGDGNVSADELKTGLARLQEAGGGRGAEALKKRLEKAEGKKE